jgi:hypothetical protein
MSTRAGSQMLHGVMVRVWELHNTQIICSTVKFSFIFAYGNPVANLVPRQRISLIPHALPPTSFRTVAQAP